MRALYRAVAERLDRVDFDAIWRGFHSGEFALYDGERAYLRDCELPTDKRFLGNTSIDFNGERLAIWRVTDEDHDPDALAANLVHELFHSFQFERGERRFPNDLELLRYPDGVPNHRVRYFEQRCLADALTSDGEELKRLLNAFMAARKYRETLIGGAILQEYRAETVEGLAEYAGISALRQLSPELYGERLVRFGEALRDVSGNFLDVRRTLYYTGAVFCICASRAGIELYHDIGDAGGTLFELVSGDIEPFPPELAEDSIAELVRTEGEERDACLREFFAAASGETVGSFRIVGYDPMNMFRRGDILYCKRFVMLDGEGGDAEFIEGPVALRMEHDSADRASAYVK